MAVRVAINFDCDQEMKDEMEERFDDFKTSWGEIYRELTRELLKRPKSEMKAFLLTAREHDLSRQAEKAAKAQQKASAQ